MAAPKWFEYEVYFNNKLEAMKAEGENITAEGLKTAFEKAGYPVDEDGLYRHFLDYGNAENISPNPYFVEAEYLANKLEQWRAVEGNENLTEQDLRDVLRNAGLSAWDHYTLSGMEEGINPSQYFDTNAYLAAKAAEMGNVPVEEVVAAFRAAGLNPIMHYEDYGREEGLTFTPGTPPAVPPIPDTPDVPPVDPDVTYTNSVYLTAGMDTAASVGLTSGNDDIHAYEFDGVNTLQTGDVIIDNGGSDRLTADLTAGSSFGQILNTVTPLVSGVEIVRFNSRQSTDNYFNDQAAVAVVDAERIDTAMRELWNVNSRASLRVEDVRVDSNKLTVVMQNTDPAMEKNADYTVLFNSQNLKSAAQSTTGTLSLELIDIRGEIDDNLPLKSNTYDVVRFDYTVDGFTETVRLNFGVVNGEATYQDLVNAINTALDAEGYTNIRASISGTFTRDDPKGFGIAVGDVIILSASDGTLALPSTGNGWLPTEGVPPNSDLSTNMIPNQSTDCPLIQTNVELDNVGRVQWNDAKDENNPNCLPDDIIYGSNSGALIIGSIADRGGIERMDIEVDRGSWLSEIRSTNEALRMITVQGDDINDDGIIGNTKAEANNADAQPGQLYVGSWNGNWNNRQPGDEQGNDNNSTTWTDADWAQLLWGGLTDVAIFDAAPKDITGASIYSGDINIGAAITEASYRKYLKAVDSTDNLNSWAPLTGYDTAFTYRTGTGNDVINMTLNGAVAADIDFKMDITTNGGEDLVAFRYEDLTANQALNQKDFNNVQINTGADADTVWFYGGNTVGGGSVDVDADAGNDAVYVNQREFFTGGMETPGVNPGAYNAVFVFNTADRSVGIEGPQGATLLNDMLGGTASFSLDSTEIPEGFNSLWVSVEFRGYTGVTQIKGIPDGSGVSAEAIEVNGSIIRAIEGSELLSELIVARDGAGYGLIIESLINGQMDTEDLNIRFYLQNSRTGELLDRTLQLTGDAYDTQMGSYDPADPYANYSGSDAAVNTQAIVDLGTGYDVLALGVNNRVDVVELSGSQLGDNHLVNFEIGRDVLNLYSLGSAGAYGVGTNRLDLAQGLVVIADEDDPDVSADWETGIYSDADINDLVEDGQFGFTANSPVGATGYVLLRARTHNIDGEQNWAYTVVEVTRTANGVSAQKLGSVTVESDDPGFMGLTTGNLVFARTSNTLLDDQPITPPPSGDTPLVVGDNPADPGSFSFVFNSENYTNGETITVNGLGTDDSLTFDVPLSSVNYEGGNAADNTLNLSVIDAQNELIYLNIVSPEITQQAINAVGFSGLGLGVLNAEAFFGEGTFVGA